MTDDLFCAPHVKVLRIGLEVEGKNGAVWSNLTIDPMLGAYVVIPGYRLIFEINPDGKGRVYRERMEPWP